jgi:hypothetical protein
MRERLGCSSFLRAHKFDSITRYAWSTRREFPSGVTRKRVRMAHSARPKFFRAVVGVVAERETELKPRQPDIREKGYTGMVGVGIIRREYEARGFDLLEFGVEHNEGLPAPSSYEGMSGSALWKFRIDAKFEPTLLGIEGVAFYQSKPATDGARFLVCHGPNGIYEELAKAVRDRWPAE